VLPVRRHAVIADPNSADFTSGWSELPPVIFLENAFKVKPQALVLAEFIEENSLKRYPAIIISEAGGSKSTALMMRDFWRWGLEKPGDDGVLEPLLSRLIRWLAVRKIDKRVKLAFDREIFSNQEQVGFTVTVLDENYLPLDGVDVFVDISMDDKAGGHTALEGVGRGRYRGSFRSWTEGEYNVAVSTLLDEQSIGEDHGKVTVEPFSIELLAGNLNEELLRGIGEASGGGYVPVAVVDSLFGSFDFSPVERENVRIVQLWGRAWLLIVIISLLAVEWIIRVRLGML